MLGKRSRNNGMMRRTTSMSEVAAAAAEQGRPQQRAARGGSLAAAGPAAARVVGGGGQRRISGDCAVVETAPFLKACGLCKRRLGPGRDTFMYRGEVAFCSLECRQQQMNLDEHKEQKCSLTSIKDAQSAASGSSEQSGNGETAAAA